ncbi:MAG: hypothetical protein HZA04_05550 [Nitrospinae bacterium]|nr:hypothetical protein [Nitrospinota bacterium]
MNVRAASLWTLLFALALFTGVAAAEPPATACIALAKRQSALFTARAKSDWKAMYAFILPAQRGKISLEQFMDNPHEMPPKSAKSPIAISGAKTAEEELKQRYVPAPFQYFIEEFRLSASGTEAMVLSEVRVPAPPMMNALMVMRVANADFWRYESGEWYLDMEAGQAFHASGAQTGKPGSRLTESVTARELAGSLLARAEQLSGAERQSALDDALWVDTSGTVQRIAERRISAGILPVSHLKRIFAEYGTYRNYFQPMMDMGDLFSMAGDHESAYDGFLAAHLAYGASVPALAGAARSAAAMERWQPAAEHFIDLLNVSAISGKSAPESLEPLLRGGCPLCAKLPPKTLKRIADGLIRVRQPEIASEVYASLLTAGAGWSDARAKLEKGKAVPLEDLLGPELAPDSARFTYDEAEKLFGAAGISLAHPDDAPAGFSLKGKTISAASSPALFQEDYSTGYFSGRIPAAVSIVWPGGKVEQSSQGEVGGYAAVFIRGGTISGGYHKDNGAGSAKNFHIADALGAIKKGTGVILARLPVAAYPVDDATAKAFGSIGVDVALLGGNISSLVVFGVKGARPGTARVFTGDGALAKTFLPSNEAGEQSIKGPVLKVSGLGANDAAWYRK